MMDKKKTHFNLSMDDLTGIFEQVPRGMLPELLCKLAIISLDKGVWKVGGINRTMTRLEDKYWQDYERKQLISHVLKNVA